MHIPLALMNAHQANQFDFVPKNIKKLCVGLLFRAYVPKFYISGCGKQGVCVHWHLVDMRQVNCFEDLNEKTGFMLIANYNKFHIK